ncbi:hypothetical protein [Nocardia sp. SC052]|uniref:hypothetical protein n=1 Tax=Nocardia sichangensis TaxID=3385975 RepID=UPI0039A33733
MIKWAGGLIIFLGLGHTFAGVALTAPRHAGAWFSRDLWLPAGGFDSMTAANGAFWLTTGSFGIPLAIIGMIILWMDRRGIEPPLFIAWLLGMWATVAAVIFEPAPWLLTWVASGLLVAGTRHNPRRPDPAP